MESKQKVIVILGPTASGKTSLGVKLAAEFNGEIISADSRQVYRGLDIGSGKDLAEYKIKESGQNIKHYMIDVADPKERFSLAQYQEMANGAIKNILGKNKLPIIVGGSGLYLQALVDGYALNDVKPDLEKRKESERKTAEELYEILLKINKGFAEKLNDSDRKNKRRLIRYVEIMQTKHQEPQKAVRPDYDFLILGIKADKEILHHRIHKRLIDRLENEDMIGEVENLHREGLSWERLEEFGLEYKYVSQYLQDKFDYEQTVEKLFQEIKRFAKRQMTWFRRWEKQGRDIAWISQFSEGEQLTREFLK